jgi:hypothetical protein
VTDRDEKLRAMQRVVEHVVRGRWDDARQPNDGEIKGTTILALALDEASAKIRSGPPVDDDSDLELPVWAGVIPLRVESSEPVADAGVAGPPPAYAADYRRLT